MRLSFVKFNTPVTMGTHARDGWSFDTGLNGPGQGKITVAEKGDTGLMFTYEAGPLLQHVLVPWANIAHATWVKVPGEPEKGKTK